MTISHASDDQTRPGAAAFLLFSVLVAPAAALAADAMPLFSNKWLIEATIEAPFQQIMRTRSEDQELEGSFTYQSEDGSQIQLDIKVRIRGHFRAEKDTCDFAPLRLNFKKKQVANTEFAGQNKLKLVTHCENSGKRPEQLVLKEYLTYQFLAALTENAFYTRLLRVTYVDSDRPGKARTKYALLIEEKENLADRVGTKLAKVGSVRYAELDRAQTNLITVFSYFIGNTDYSAGRGPSRGFCCHNIVLLEQESGIKLPIPYDFDFSGMVDAPYAAPLPRFGIRSVTQRLYRGLCQNNDLLDETFSRFHDRRDEIYALITVLPDLSKKSRVTMTRFIDKFYETITDEKRVNKRFVKKCSAATAPPSQT